MNTNPFHIVVCDTQRLVREAVAQLIESEFPAASVVCCAAMPDAVAAAQARHAELLVLLSSICESRHVAPLAAIASGACPAAALLCIADDVPPAGIRSLAGHIEGWMLMSEPAPVLFAAIRRLRRGDRFQSPSVLRLESHGKTQQRIDLPKNARPCSNAARSQDAVRLAEDRTARVEDRGTVSPLNA